MDPYIFLIQVLNGVQYGLLLFLLASGLTLIFGIMGVINLAHGAFYMVGAYLAFALTRWLGDLWLALPIGFALMALLGLALEKLLFARLYMRDHLDQVLMTFGLILVLEELRGLAFDQLWPQLADDVLGVEAPALLGGSIPLTETLSYPVYRLAVSLACLGVAAALYVLVQRTRLGMIIRAGAENREMVEALGLNIDRLFMIVFALGVGLAGLAGILAAPIYSVFPGMGHGELILSFVVVVIGGVGSIRGAFVGALLIGVAQTFGQVLWPAFASVTVYFLMAAVLVWRPTGLFGAGGAR